MTLSTLPQPAALTESMLAKHLQPNVRGEQNATLIQPTGTCVQYVANCCWLSNTTRDQTNLSTHHYADSSRRL
jgi:hypothetical protein